MVRHHPDLVHSNLYLRLGYVLVARDQMLRVKKLSAGAHPDLIHHGRLQVHQDGSRHVFAGPRIREESVEPVDSEEKNEWVQSRHQFMIQNIIINLTSVRLLIRCNSL